MQEKIELIGLNEDEISRVAVPEGKLVLLANTDGRLLINRNGMLVPAIPDDLDADIDEIRALALGANVAYVFDTYEQMNDWLGGEYEREDGKTPDGLNAGNLLLLRQKDVPDYWWDGEQVRESETEKVDLTDYVTLAAFNAHAGDTAAHITEAERTAWNGKEAAITKNTAFNINFETAAANIKTNGTVSIGTLSTVARADHVHPTDATRAPLASPALTGTPTAPTAAKRTNTTQLATTAFVTDAVNELVTSGGTTTALTASVTGWSETAGRVIRLQLATAIGANATLSVNSGTARQIRTPMNTQIEANIVASGAVITLVYYNTYFFLTGG